MIVRKPVRIIFSVQGTLVENKLGYGRSFDQSSKFKARGVTAVLTQLGIHYWLAQSHTVVSLL